MPGEERETEGGGVVKELSLFSGAGGGLLASKHLLGWETVGYVEIEEYCQKVLAQRIKDGLLDEAPIFTDIRAFNNSGCAALYYGITDIISGGFPCTDISCAKTGAEGIDGKQSGLWKEMLSTICTVRPRYVFVENTAALLGRGFSTVLKDLSESGYNAKWDVFPAAAFGIRHIRERLFVFATTEPVDNTDCINARNIKRYTPAYWRWLQNDSIGSCFNGLPWSDEPELDRVAYGVANSVDRNKAIGNGQVPICAAIAFKILSGLA